MRQAAGSGRRRRGSSLDRIDRMLQNGRREKRKDEGCPPKADPPPAEKPEI